MISKVLPWNVTVTGMNSLIELYCKQSTVRENVFTSYSDIFFFFLEGFLLKIPSQDSLRK